MNEEFRYIFGEWRPATGPLTACEVVEICKVAASKRTEVAGYPIDKVFRILEKMRIKWLDSRYEPRKEIEELLPRETGFSPEMIKLGIDELCWTLNPDLLRKKMKTEFREISRNNDYRFDPVTQTAFAWQPLGIVLHVLAGNVFLGAAGSLVEGLITGNVNILKMSSSEKIFLPALIKSLAQCDDDGIISRSLAVIDYASSQADVVEEFKKNVDGIIVWGGEEAVKAYRNNLPARSKLVIFGPKLSLALVTRDGFQSSGVSNIASDLSKELGIWDQNACTAPQVCYVEGFENAIRLGNEMAVTMESHERTLPAGRVEPENAVEIQKLRSIFEIAEARGEGLLRESARDLDWTVIVDKDPALEPSPLHRTIRIIPFSNPEDIFGQIEALRGYIQTVGVVASPVERWSLSKRLAECGALRIVSLGKMATGEIDDPHDGSFDLPQLMRLTTVRFPFANLGIDPIDVLPDSAREEIIDERLRLLIDKARKTQFYSQRLEGVEINEVADLAKMGPLTREEMDSNMPPKGNGLGSGPYTGGYISRSGGSTGEPKFSVYDDRDWDQMIGHAVRVLRALGLKRGDRLANCFLAGDLYGSFVSFDHINYRLGVTSFAFANTVKAETFLDTWRKFRINSIMGVPTTIVPLLRAVKEMEPSFSLEKVVFAGSPMSETDRDWLKSTLGVERVGSVIGANDGGQIAFQCDKMFGAIHHAIDDFNYLEIVDESGKRVPDGKPGRILITSLLKYAFPLIRYDLGDLGRILPGPCSCGRTTRVIEYLGRADDIVAVGLLNLNYRDFRDALGEIPVSEMQLVIKSDEKGETLVVRVEIGKKPIGLNKRILNILLKKLDKLQSRVFTGELKIKVETVGPGLLPRNPRSGKIRNIVDERL